MKRSILVCALVLATSVVLGAQQGSQPGQYSGTSNPPPDDMITTPDAVPDAPANPIPKPHAGHLANSQAPSAPHNQLQNADMAAQDNAMPQPITDAGPATDAGTVQIAPNISAQPATDADGQPGLNSRAYANDPDGDIVHPEGRPGELVEGTTIRARLLDRISTSDSKTGDAFRTTVASDVRQGDQVLIPTGSEIDGIVVSTSSGHMGGHGSMLLRPETVILADGQRFKLFGQVSSAPGSETRITGEGQITPASRLKKDGIEYGGGVGAGAVTGAILGGPAGALAGTIVGASAVTVHLLMDRPQATLDSGTVLQFTLTEPLSLVAAGPPSGN